MIKEITEEFEKGLVELKSSEDTYIIGNLLDLKFKSYYKISKLNLSQEETMK